MSTPPKPGRGRPRNADKYKKELTEAWGMIADDYVALMRDYLKIAHGGYERVETEYQPSELVTIRVGQEYVRAYPNAKPGDMAIVKERRSMAEPDKKAIEDLISRLAGRIPQAIDVTTDADIDRLPAHLASHFRRMAADYADETMGSDKPE